MIRLPRRTMIPAMEIIVRVRGTFTPAPATTSASTERHSPMTPQQIASTILDEFTTSPNLYPNLDMDGNTSGSVVALSTSTGVTITVTIFATTATTARVEMEHGDSPVSSAIFTDFSSPEGLVDATIGYIARILHQLNHQAAA